MFNPFMPTTKKKDKNCLEKRDCLLDCSFRAKFVYDIWQVIKLYTYVLNVPLEVLFALNETKV